MSTINNVAGNVYDQLGLTRSADTSTSDDLGQTDFLKLMTTQLQNQDPFAPMDNTEFLSQMAQFGTVSGVDKLNDSFASLASTLNGNRALQASMIVGSQVLVPSDVHVFNGSDPLHGAVDLPGRVDDLKIRIEDMSGRTLATLAAGEQPAGMSQFTWNGDTTNGLRAPAGNYRIVAEAIVNDEAVTFETLATANVDSVTLGRGSGEFTLSLAGLGEVSLDQVRQIKQ